MKPITIAALAIVSAGGLVRLASADDPVPGAGWTGVGNPEDVISARQALMIAIEELTLPIDTYTIDGGGDSAAITAAAETIAAMLLAVPHLFPPTTNLYDPTAELPATLALPKLWEDFPTFYTMALASAAAATTLAETTDTERLRTAGRSLRASCDACHTLYLRPYVPSEVSQEDLDFDFDSVLPAE
jgi:cytochrome c556